MKKCVKTWMAWILVIVMVCGITGCTGSKNHTGNGDGEITLTDQAGRVVTLEKTAETIVSCYYITTYATIALGISDRVVGLEKKAETRPIYAMADPSLLEKPQVGSMKEFNVEAAAALHPDLVLMPKKLSEHADTLTQLGISVLVVNPESQSELEEMLRLIGRACGVEEKAESLIRYYQTQLSEMQTLTDTVSRPVVYMAGNSTYLHTAPAAMYQASLIEIAGGVNAAASLEGDYWTEISYETLLAMNPEIIIIPCGADYTVEDVLQDTQLSAVTAVKNGNVYHMPDGLEEWDSPIPAGILGAMWLCSVLHPEVYSFDSFTADVSAFYEEFYGFTVDTALITR